MCKICADLWFENITPKQFEEAIRDTSPNEHTKEIIEFIESEEFNKV